MLIPQLVVGFLEFSSQLEYGFVLLLELTHCLVPHSFFLSYLLVLPLILDDPQLGFEFFVVLPFTLEQLFQLLHSLLGVACLFLEGLHGKHNLSVLCDDLLELFPLFCQSLVLLPQFGLNQSFLLLTCELLLQAGNCLLLV